jgi:fused signal recognition particle receptor
VPPNDPGPTPGPDIPAPGPEEVPASPPDFVPAPAPQEAPAPDLPQEIPTGTPNEIPTNPGNPGRTTGFLGRLFGREEAPARAPAAPVVRRALDDDMVEQLEELLIAADMGVDTALRVTSNLAEGRMGRRMSVAEIKGLLAAEISRIMEPVARPMPLYPRKPQVVLVVGVNGSGKTTTIGKLAKLFREQGRSVMLAAGDTFRAAATEQLQIWGERVGAAVIARESGADAAGLAFDALAEARKERVDVLLIDTAGRLQNKADLMAELQKIIRVLKKQDADAPHACLLVLDATVGQNAHSQVQVFSEMTNVSGLVVTKLDGTAKGGVVVALAKRFGLPVHAVGVGEGADDLRPFNARTFARNLLGLEA